MLESQVAETTTTVAESTHAVAEPTRRDFLFIATGAAAAIGGATLIWPFVQSLSPDALTVAAGAPVEVDLAPIAEGQIVKVFWRGKLIFVRHRTAEEIKAAEDVNVAELRDPQPDSARVKDGKAPWLIVYGNCTHLGCVPLGQQGEYHGWCCPCHGSIYDRFGVIKAGPAPRPMDIMAVSIENGNVVVDTGKITQRTAYDASQAFKA